MNQAVGAKQRVIERNRYNPTRKAFRDVRVISERGATQTFKKRGDIIIDSMGRKHEVKSNGWQ